MEYNTYDDLVTALARTNDDIEKTQGASKRTHLIDEKRAIVAAMEAYPLADDDLFRCERCQQVFDIEESIKDDHQLICSFCHSDNQ
tara:strand:+ start:5049 stop:5306 length:258 start_codon:yes stop_codon:yes gene_type:complete